ncbi:MAG: AsmA family protein [Xanthobacteraceae bacterium]|nr:AsmA family protein [Xanthobacteraceae bacterium]
MTAVTGIKRVGLAVASLLGAGLALLLILSVVIPADAVRDAVKSQIRAVTGLDPVLRGDVSVSLFPTGSVRFNDVSLGDSTGAPALSAQQLLVRLRFFSFLFGRIEIADVTLVRPTIMIAFASDGTSNWGEHIGTLAQALTPTNLERAKSFSEIRISEGTAIIRDEAYRIVETLNHLEFALAWPSISKTFAATGQFSWNGQLFDGTLSLSDFLAALTGERTGVKVRLTGAPLKFAFDGNMSSRPTLRVEGVVAADAPSLRDALSWTAATIIDRPTPGGAFQRFALKAQTSVVGRNIALSKVNLELDGNVGEGVLTYVADGRRTLQGTLAVERLNLTPYMSAFRLLNAERSWSRLPLELDALGGMDVDLRISAARVTADGFNLGQTAVATNLRSGNLTLAIGESQAFGGVIRGSLALAKSTAGADLQAQLQFTEVMLDQALDAFFGVRRVEGRGDIAVAVASSGASIYDLAKGLNGTVTMASHKGAISGFNVEQSLKRLERNPLAVRGSDFRGGRTPYDELAVKLKVTDGTAHAQDVRIETPAMRVGLAGSSSIAARDFDLKGTASLSAGGAVDAFQLPFVVMGTWDDPLFWPDIQLLIRRSGAAAPLLDAVRNRLNREQAPTLAGEASAPPPAAAPPAATPGSPR